MLDGSRAIAALMHELIDYAGLFPPAAHTMAEASSRYARYRLSPHAPALGRFVVPAARLVEWEQAVTALSPAQRNYAPWRLTALAAPPCRREIPAIVSFNERSADGHEFSAHVDSIEVNVTTPEEVREVAAVAPDGLRVFFECPVTDRLDPLLDAVAAAGASAKIRTGGIVPDAIAPPAAVARFVAACAAQDVAFKATAGLHHPVRAVHPLTYESGAPRVAMNGFLNVFVAAVLARQHHLDASQVLPVLEETAPEAFVFSDSGLAWRDVAVTTTEVLDARRFALSFGSCSFDEPIRDLIALGLLSPVI